MRLSSLFPALAWLPRYQRQNLGADILAGLTTAIMLVPQAMAYAMLAGLPPEVGLYAAVIPPAIYAFMGTSRQLAVGPVAMDSLLVAVALAPLAEGGSAEYVALAVLLALMVGLLQIGMGLLRMGFVTNFLSNPVISGFTSAAALIIGLNQLKHMTGLELIRGASIFGILSETIARFTEVSGLTLAMGCASFVALILLKRVAPKVPRALVVVVLATLVTWGLDLSSVAIVGSVPAGLPAPSLPEVRWELWGTLMPSAVAIALVGFMESISVSKALASQAGYKVQSSQELVALGAANLGGAFFSAYPITGGFSRSAVNAQAGARTNLSGLVTAGLVFIALSFFTPLFYYLPKTALAAIIMAAVFGLIDLKEPLRLWRVHRADFVILVLTFLATLGLGIQQGILIGILASLGLFLLRSTRPHYAVLGRLPGTNAYRNVLNHPAAETLPGVLVVRFDDEFYFGNVSFLESTLERIEAAAKWPYHAIVFDFSSVNQLDSTADQAVRELALSYRKRGVLFRIAEAKRPVLTVMERSGLAELLGEDAYYLTIADAVSDLGASA